MRLWQFAFRSGTWASFSRTDILVALYAPSFWTLASARCIGHPLFASYLIRGSTRPIRTCNGVTRMSRCRNSQTSNSSIVVWPCPLSQKQGLGDLVLSNRYPALGEQVFDFPRMFPRKERVDVGRQAWEANKTCWLIISTLPGHRQVGAS